MAKQNFSEMTTEALQKQQKSLKLVTGILAGTLMALVAMNIILFQKNGFSAQTVIPIALSPILFLNISTIQQIKKELKSRGI